MGKFEIKQAKNGCPMFNLKAGNGEVIGTSVQYSSVDACKSVQKNAPIANLEDQTKEGYETAKNPKFEIYQDKRGEFRFRLKAGNGEIILTGEGYKAKTSCKKGIASIRKNAVDSPIVEKLDEV